MFPRVYFPPVYFPPVYFPGPSTGGIVPPDPPVVTPTGVTFAEIKQNIKDDLEDQSIHFSALSLHNSVQWAYDEMVAISHCIIKKIVLPFQDDLNYYNFRDDINFPAIYVSDLMGVTAVFSNLTNLWLLDDKVLKDFDRDRIDWENWYGSTIWWAPTKDYRRYAFIPKMMHATSTFDLYYWASAPVVVDSESPLIPSDFIDLLIIYAEALLYEQAREFKKARELMKEFWGVDEDGQNYDKGIYELVARTKNITKSDLLMLA